MIKTIWLLACYLLLAVSCNKPAQEMEVAEPEYFVFGMAYGECQGDCVTFFAIDNGLAYADDMNYFYRNGEDIQLLASALPHDKYEQIRNLKNKLPDYLAKHTNQTFGCPDCHDQGLIYIEGLQNGQKVHWMIDTDVEKQPVEIRNYIAELLTVFKQLK